MLQSAAGTIPPPRPQQMTAMASAQTTIQPSAWLRRLSECLERTACLHQGGSTSLEAGLEALVGVWSRLRANGRCLFWAGNGGSAALASHLSQDLLNKCGLKSLTFNDPALLTCMANDYGYAETFKRPLAALAQEGDLLVAVSSSGMSSNIVEAAQAALEMGLEVAAFSAFAADNRLHRLPTTLSFHVPTNSYGQAELAHGALLHAALDCLEQELLSRTLAQ